MPDADADAVAAIETPALLLKKHDEAAAETLWLLHKLLVESSSETGCMLAE
jgi:hypothetical protein